MPVSRKKCKTSESQNRTSKSSILYNYCYFFYLPAITVSLRSYFPPVFGKSFSFLPLNFNSPLKWASSKIRSKDFVSWFCRCPFIFETDNTSAITHISSTEWWPFWGNCSWEWAANLFLYHSFDSFLTQKRGQYR